MKKQAKDWSESTWAPGNSADSWHNILDRGKQNHFFLMKSLQPSCSVFIAELFKNLLAHPRHKLQFSNKAVYNPVKILFLRVRSALQNEDSYGEEILLLFFLLMSVKIAQFWKSKLFQTDQTQTPKLSNCKGHEMDVKDFVMHFVSYRNQKARNAIAIWLNSKIKSLPPQFRLDSQKN